MKKRYWIAGVYGVAGAALAVKLLTRPRDVEWAEHAPRLPHAEKSRFVEVEGVPIHFQEAGDPGAPTLLLVHGFCASTFVWSDVIVPLAAEGFRVIAPDLVGYGFSGKPADGEYTIESQARMITGLMDQLGLARATLVGSSYGGAVSAVCALDCPERVERLVLVGAVSNDDVKKMMLLRLAATPLMGDLLSPVLMDIRLLVRRRMRKVYAETNGHLLDEDRIAAHHGPLRAASTHRAALRTLRRWSATRIEAEAARIKHPVLLVWGAQDRDVPLKNGERLHQLIPGSRLFVFPNSGHLPQEERPTEFVSLVSDFCKS
ncbi:MAG: alpha/beta fold hydrolase [Pyrinomonadaceae bacterium]